MLTFIFLVIFFILFFMIGLGFDFFYYLSHPKVKFIPLLTIIAMITSIIIVVNGFINGINMIIKSTGAREANPNNLKEKQFLNVVSEMSLAAGIPMPKAYIIPDNDLNAFATGFSPEKSYVFITQGLLKQLDREELQAVIAHEITHIRFYDIRLMTITTVLINAIAIISDMISRTNRSTRVSSSSRNRNPTVGILFLVWVVLVIVAPILSKILAMAISRQREYLADAGAAELTRNPKALISALEKIRNSVQPTKNIKEAVAHMCITDPRGSLIEEKTGFFAELFATHPPMEKRILALKLMAYEQTKDSHIVDK